MADSPAADIAEYLEDQGHGALADSIWINSLPDGNPYADDIITVTDLSGTTPVNSMGGNVLETPNVQVRVRNNSRLTSQQKCYAVYLELNRTNFTLNSYDYWVEATHQPAYMMMDGNDRTHFVCNFMIRRRSS